MLSERQLKYKVTREHVDSAITAINQRGLPSGFRARTRWMVSIGGSEFPIKVIVALACEAAGLHTTAKAKLDGTEYFQWRRHLRRLGYRFNRLEDGESYEGESDLAVGWGLALDEQSRRMRESGSIPGSEPLEVLIGGDFVPACEALGLPVSTSPAILLNAARASELGIRVTPDPVDAELDALANSDALSTESRREINGRIGQGRFRTALLALHGCCALTGVTTPEVLRACHIHRWADCADAPSARHDPENGLLLTANLDALFEAGLIAFDDDGVILISPRLNADAQAALGVHAGMRLLTAPSHAQRCYLNRHRERTRSMRPPEAT
ncbi:HNH endonuclease signature motif containing protein [Burkholderia sp. BCC1977]|uniref:HNH endonuclease n=1 Tax=Burkholderia sp. BCC1977 TaxID=2817440 RepID=UPI002ABE96FF|nr:HNH endonuclease signature motif containing protein [Burkholderia sp. BCC1977]